MTDNAPTTGLGSTNQPTNQQTNQQPPETPSRWITCATLVNLNGWFAVSPQLRTGDKLGLALAYVVIVADRSR